MVIGKKSYEELRKSATALVEAKRSDWAYVFGESPTHTLVSMITGLAIEYLTRDPERNLQAAVQYGFSQLTSFRYNL